MLSKESRKEAKLRTLRLNSQDESIGQHDAAELAFSRVINQTHETIMGIRRVLTNRRKIAKYRAITKRIFSKNVDIRRDAINQLKALDDDT